MKICSEVGCSSSVVARGLCAKHYQYAKYHGRLPPTQRTGRTVVPVTHPLYKVWSSMKTRCTNPNSKSYERYGGSGVTYAEAWEDFNTFYLDMSDGYRPGLWLDRRDGTKGYSKENCRWVTPTESNRNRSSVLVTEELAFDIRRQYAAGGVTQIQLGAYYGLDQTTISDIVRGKSWN